MSKWRPIKTAPKDQQILLACLENCEDFYVCQGRWVDVPHSNTWTAIWRANAHLPMAEIDKLAAKNVEGHWMEAHIGIMQHNTGSHTYEHRGGILFRPSHWMPLPKAPTSKSAWRRARKIAGQT